MIIYNYDKDSKIYTGSSEAVLSPLENDVYILPAYSTKTKVIENKLGFDIIYNDINDVWEYKEIDIVQENLLLIENSKKLEAALYLNSTDWYIIRKLERDIDIPENITLKRLEAIGVLDGINN